jgi:predicted transcriptional regulator
MKYLSMQMKKSVWYVTFYFCQNFLVVSALVCCRWSKLEVSCLNLVDPLSVIPAVTCQEAVHFMRKEGFDQLPVVEVDG